jgi:hypothetical protein
VKYYLVVVVNEEAFWVQLEVVVFSGSRRCQGTGRITGGAGLAGDVGQGRAGWQSVDLKERVVILFI